MVRPGRNFLIVMDKSNFQAVSIGSRGNTFGSFPIPQERTGSRIRLAGKMLFSLFHRDYEAYASTDRATVRLSFLRYRYFRASSTATIDAATGMIISHSVRLSGTVLRMLCRKGVYTASI